MILYPAVDLLEGRSVRLTQGDYDRANVYHEDPLEPVQGFKQAGAKWLHEQVTKGLGPIHPSGRAKPAKRSTNRKAA